MKINKKIFPDKKAITHWSWELKNGIMEIYQKPYMLWLYEQEDNFWIIWINRSISSLKIC